MRVNLVIRTTQDDVEFETVNMRADYIETEDAHIISYIESTYDNLIVIDKKTKVVTVEKKSTIPREIYYSKLIFEDMVKNKCSIDIDDYSMFVDIETKKITITKGNREFRIKLQYNINDSYNIVEVILEW